MKRWNFLTAKPFWCCVVAVVAAVLRLMHQSDDTIRAVCDIILNLAMIAAIVIGKPWPKASNDNCDDDADDHIDP